MLASILVATVPAWTALFAHLIRLERLTARQWSGQLLAFAGVVIIVSRGEMSVLRLTTGALWVLGAPVAWALYSVVARPLLSRAPSSLPLTGVVVLLGTILMTPFTPDGTLGRLGALDAGAWLQLLFVALLSTFAGYLVWAWAIQRMEATRASAAIYFVPVTSALVSILFFAERISLLVVLGGASILGGVLLIQGFGSRDVPREGLPSGPAAR
jgi:drug/metabolite transporter (DMT)-like permease